MLTSPAGFIGPLVAKAERPVHIEQKIGQRTPGSVVRETKVAFTFDIQNRVEAGRLAALLITDLLRRTNSGELDEVRGWLFDPALDIRTGRRTPSSLFFVSPDDPDRAFVKAAAGKAARAMGLINRGGSTLLPPERFLLLGPRRGREDTLMSLSPAGPAAQLVFETSSAHSLWVHFGSDPGLSGGAKAYFVVNSPRNQPTDEPFFTGVDGIKTYLHLPASTPVVVV